jgi:adenylate cyclase
MDEQTEIPVPRTKELVCSPAKMVIIDGQGRREVILGEYTSIGRDARNSIQILDRLVSKEHCLIQFDHNQGYLIKDLGSSNGTFVNQSLLQGERLLGKGDTINIGATRLIFLPEESEDHRFQFDDGEQIVQLKEIRSKVSPSHERFLPEKEIGDGAVLRADYEKLRLTYELQRTIGLELDLDRIFSHILVHTFNFLDCDRAVILMVDESGELKLRALKTRKKDEKMIISSTLVKQVKSEKVGIITADALADSRFDCAQSIVLQTVRSSMAVPILYENQLLGIMIIDSSVSVNAYSEKDLSLLTNIANQAAQFIKNAEMTKKIELDAVTRERFQRLLSPDLAEMVVSGELKVEKGGESRVSTVLFADIRGFTAMSEDMSAAKVLQMLNEYFEMMVEIVFRYEGTVDKFVGDMVMVIWGAPVAHEDDPIRAVRAAMDMQAAIIGYNTMRSLMGQPPINVGIGINTGELVAGYIGSTRTMSYSVIGDSVNIASRLCSAAEPGQILISEATYGKIGDQFTVAELAPVRAKGKSKPLKVFSVLSP